MAENHISPIENNESQTAVPKAPSKARTFITNHKRKLVVTTLAVGAGVAAYAAGKKRGHDETVDSIKTALELETNSTPETTQVAEA